MTDDPTTILAQASAACYGDGATYDWQSSSRLAHAQHHIIAGHHVVAFAGTLSAEEWILRDLFALQVPVIGHPALGDVHAGFLIDAEDATAWLRPKLERLGNPPYWLTGHSKGAADAILVHALMLQAGRPPELTRVFEPPMAGGADLQAYLGSQDIRWTQTFNADGPDVVTVVRSLPTFRPLAVSPIRLPVPDADGWATKHRMPAVLTSLAAREAARQAPAAAA